MNVTTAIIHDTRRAKNSGLYPVKLRVTFDRKQRYYPTKYDLSKAKFKHLTTGEKFTNSDKKDKASIQDYENKAIAIIAGMPVFNWKTFESRYLTNRGAKDTLNFAFKEYADSLRSSENLGSAVVYECSQNSLDKFAPGAVFSDVTPDFLKRYEKWMLTSGNSITTVGIYLRSLRTLFNNAINSGLLSKDLYPFGRGRYEIPTSTNVKKALTLSDISKIYYYKAPAGSAAAKAKDYWLFMYLCNGINVKDMCLLRYGNLKGEVLEFIRAKTARTKRNVEPIRVALVDDIRAIIKRLGNIRKDDSTYLFPILKPGMTAEKQRATIQQATKVINANMKAIAAELKIESDTNTYSARHSFASVLQRSGVSTEFISEALGHTNVKTTQNYLAGFEDSAKLETVKALTAFKKNK